MQEFKDAWRDGKKYFAVSRGRQIAYVEREGVGPPLLLLHGYTDSSRSYSLLESHLSGRHLIIPDLCGHGDSPPHGNLGLTDLAEDIARLTHEKTDDPVFIVGHSMGGMIALLIAHHYPAMCAKVVVMSSSLCPSFTANDPHSIWINQQVDPIDKNDGFFVDWHSTVSPVSTQFKDLMRVEAAHIPVRVWQTLYQNLCYLDLTSVASCISKPILIISGSDDPLFDHSHSDTLLKTLKRSEHFLIKNCGHNPHWEQPAIAGRKILEFITV